MGYSAGQVSAITREGSGAELVWEWNQTDLTQFEAIRYYRAGGGVSTRTVTPTILPTNGAYSTSPNVLGLEADANTDTDDAVAVLLVSDPMPYTTTRRRYFIDCQSNFMSPQAGSPGQGYVYMGDDSGANLVAYGGIWNRQQGFRVENGAVSMGAQFGALLTNTQQGAVIEGRAGTGSDPLGNFPHFQLQMKGQGQQITGFTRIWRNTFGANDGDYNLVPPGVAWNNTLADRWGICVFADANNPFPLFWRISALRLYAY